MATGIRPTGPLARTLLTGVFLMLFTAVGVRAQSSLPCEFCGDQACENDDELWVGPIWFPGSIEISYLGSTGCVWSTSDCGSLITCQEEETRLIHTEVLEGVQAQDWVAVAQLVDRYPDLVTVIPERSLLVTLSPECEALPAVATRVLPPGAMSVILPTDTHE
jgi:hypothetical protein